MVVKLNLDIFSPPKNGGENKFKYIFSPQNMEMKINLNIFSLTNKR